jgi:predicted  nucleic acid-binding Zn-ribbon protein
VQSPTLPESVAEEEWGVIYRSALSRPGELMPLPQEGDRWEAELRALREDLKELRDEQREMANAINQLVTTFRTLATHLGIASEPYTRREPSTSSRDLPGFG